MLRPLGTEFDVFYHSSPTSGEIPHTIVVRWRVKEHVLDEQGAWVEVWAFVRCTRNGLPNAYRDPKDREIKSTPPG